MKMYLDIEKIIASGCIKDELEFARAMTADRKLRLLAADSEHFKAMRTKLRRLLLDYEARVWRNGAKITDDLVELSDLAEAIAEKERVFVNNRKNAILKKLKSFGLTQAELGLLLGHKSKTHMSELMNGLKPFTLQDLIVINLVFKISIDQLVPKYLPIEKLTRLSAAITALDKPKLNKVKLELCA